MSSTKLPGQPGPSGPRVQANLGGHGCTIGLFISILTVILIALCILVWNRVQDSSGSRMQIILAMIGIYLTIFLIAGSLIYRHYKRELDNLIAVSDGFLRDHLKYLIAITLAIGCILTLIFAFILLRSSPPPSLPPYGCSPAPCTVLKPDGQRIGVSVGLDHFWPDNSSNNAESLIYQEDNRVQEQGASYITFIVVTTLSDRPDMIAADQSEKGIGHDDLQGAYVLQKEDNGSGDVLYPVV